MAWHAMAWHAMAWHAMAKMKTKTNDDAMM